MVHKDPEARREYHRQYMRKWYAENKKKHIGYVAKVNKRRRKEFVEAMNILKSVPCADCGGTYPPECMDFDHLRDKEFSISQADHVSDAKLQEELAKCEVVCANCHRTRTKARREAGVVE